MIGGDEVLARETEGNGKFEIAALSSGDV